MVQFSRRLDTAFAAVADPTRRGIIERLGGGETSITGLAAAFDMTLTGMKKHVQLLEGAGMVTTEKIGRVRMCRLGTRPLADEAAWIANYQRMIEDRYDRLAVFLEQDQGD